MQRRQFVTGGVGALCLGAVGATQALQLQSLPRSRSDRFDVDAGAGSTSDEATGPSDRAGADGGEASARLEVLSTTAGETPVSLELRRVRDDVVVHDRVRTFTYGERAHLSGLCARGETYAFRLAVDGTTLVRTTVAPGETAVFELIDETTVGVIA